MVAWSWTAAFIELAHRMTAPLLLIRSANSRHRHSEQGCPPGLGLAQTRQGAMVVICGGRSWYVIRVIRSLDLFTALNQHLLESTYDDGALHAALDR